METQPQGVSFIEVAARDRDRAAPNNQFFYEATGDRTALEYFEVDEDTGDVSVKKSLLTDSARTKKYAFRIVAKDLGTPQRVSDNATVNIEVIRNDNEPTFEKEVYTASITQNQETGRRIITVKANDRDPEVSCADL